MRPEEMQAPEVIETPAPQAENEEQMVGLLQELEQQVADLHEVVASQGEEIQNLHQMIDEIKQGIASILNEAGNSK